MSPDFNISSIILWSLTAAVTFERSSASFWFLSNMHLSALATTAHHNMCDLIPDLSKRQRRLCVKQPDTMRALEAGVQYGMRECQRQFAGQRWNCSVVGERGPFLNTGSREAAFVYAITSAGVVQSIAKACSRGLLESCSCSSPRPIGKSDFDDQGRLFRWGGCSDNLKYAASFARRFLDSNEKKTRDGRALMNLHNNRAGRKLVKRTARLECKCHGVSGSCTTRTCWRAADHMEHLGSELVTKYRLAQQVVISPDGKQLQPAAKVAALHYDLPITESVRTDKSKSSVSAGESVTSMGGRRNNPKMQVKLKNAKSGPKIRNSELVFFEASPDYCERDGRTGSIGTAGRACNISSHGPDSCDSLCCGRGYNTRREVITEKCNCKFVWCCKVECEICTRLIEVHTCKGDGEPDFPTLFPVQTGINQNLYKPHDHVDSYPIMGVSGSQRAMADQPSPAYHIPSPVISQSSSSLSSSLSRLSSTYDSQSPKQSPTSDTSGYRRLYNSADYKFGGTQNSNLNLRAQNSNLSKIRQPVFDAQTDRWQW